MLRNSFDYNLLCKEVNVLVLGPSGVGKSSIIKLFLENRIDMYHDPTIVDFYVSRKVIDNIKYKLQITDTTGHLSLLDKKALQEIQAFILVFDLSDSKSFFEIQKFYELIVEHVKNLGAKRGPRITLCGNKTDLPRQIPFKQGLLLANKLGCSYVETSAWEGHHVEELWKETMIRTQSKQKTESCVIS